MNGFISGFIAILLFGAVWFPQTTGKAAHRLFNDIKIGWAAVE